MNKVLEINNLTTKYYTKYGINDVSFSVSKGDVVSIIGPSGAGKSTLLRTIFSLEKANSGNIKLKDGYILKDGIYQKNRRELYSKMGLIFQDYNLFDNLSVRNNIGIGLKCVGKMKKREIELKTEELLTTFNLSDKIDEYPSKLSGGEKQRIAIVRALAMNPEILLLDEPTSALDVVTINDLYNTIQFLKEKNMTLLIVTHDLNFALNVSNRIIFMKNSQIVVDCMREDIYNIDNKEFNDFVIQAKQRKDNNE